MVYETANRPDLLPRKELPANSTELSWKHTKKLLKNIYQIDKKMNPELRRILKRETNTNKLIHIKTVKELNLYQKSSFFP